MRSIGEILALVNSGSYTKLSTDDWTAFREHEAQAKDAHRASLSPVARRRFDIVETLEAGEVMTREDLNFVHSIAAFCSFPYKQPAAGQTIYQRKNGLYTLGVQAGVLTDPQGNLVQQGLPYGAKARLLFIHLCSEAMRNNSPTVEIGDTLSSFMRSMGIEPTGGATGSLARFKDQLARLVSCRLVVGKPTGTDRAKTGWRSPVQEVDLWFSNNPEQRSLWQSTVTLDAAFYEDLTKHALPLDNRALAAVQNSARKLDLVTWATYRSRSIHKPTAIGWEKLQQQFSADGTQLRHFKRKFAEDVAAINEIFGKSMRLQITAERGLIVYPAEADQFGGRGLLPARTVKKALKTAKS